MSSATITIELPEKLYQRVRRNARGLKRNAPQALIELVERALPPLDDIPPEYRAEFELMEALTDEQLWQITKETFSKGRQTRLELLLRKNQNGELTAGEKKSLTELGIKADRLMLRKSYAYLLLKYRGRPIPASIYDLSNGR